MMKIWKGLYYCFWMQDKPLLQEELAETLAGLLKTFSSKGQKYLYLETFLVTIAREWYGIDRWRMDKFMMLLRRFIRTFLVWLKSNNWNDKDVHKTLEVWSRTIMSPTNDEVPEGLKFHFASVYLDELDLAGSNGATLTPELVGKFLEPYVQIVGCRETKDQLFTTVNNEIFETILLQKSDELLGGEGSDDGETSKGIQFNYGALGQRLLKVASKNKISSSRRREIYKLVKRFQAAEAGLDPLEEDEVSEEEHDAVLSDDEIVTAAGKLIRRSEGERKHLKKRKRDESEEEISEDDVPAPPTILKKKKKTKKPLKDIKNKKKTKGDRSKSQKIVEENSETSPTKSQLQKKKQKKKSL